MSLPFRPESIRRIETRGTDQFRESNNKEDESVRLNEKERESNQTEGMNALERNIVQLFAVTGGADGSVNLWNLTNRLRYESLRDKRPESKQKSKGVEQTRKDEEGKKRNHKKNEQQDSTGLPSTLNGTKQSKKKPSIHENQKEYRDHIPGIDILELPVSTHPRQQKTSIRELSFDETGTLNMIESFTSMVVFVHWLSLCTFVPWIDSKLILKRNIFNPNTQTYTYTHTHTCTHTNTYIHTYIHTYTY